MLTAVLMAAIAAAPLDASASAARILEQHECHRCHAVEHVAPPPMQRSCAGCHRDLSSTAGDPKRTREGRAEFGKAWDRFVTRTGGRYCNVPALASMDRFRGDWLRAFLTAPYDVRPNVAESMPRHNLSDAEIEALVVAWTGPAKKNAADPPRPDAARLERGARLFETAGCGVCHLYGNRTFEVSRAFQFDFAPKLRHRALAPDLRHTRDRLTRETIGRILLDPRSVNAAAEMPKPHLSPEETEVVADFVYFGDPGVPATPSRPAPPPYDPSAPVPTYAEVEREVFKQVCWHCHSDPDFNWGDGGPGNTGGFGFPKAGLSFADWMSVMSGSVDERGKRRSILRRGESGEPVLLERLRLRYVENARDFVLPGQDDLQDRRAARSSQPRGMPLGLPALTPEQFSLVERWVRGGAPGP